MRLAPFVISPHYNHSPPCGRVVFLHGFRPNLRDRNETIVYFGFGSHLAGAVLISKLASFVPVAGTSNRFDPSLKAAGTISFCVGCAVSGALGSDFTVVIIT